MISKGVSSKRVYSIACRVCHNVHVRVIHYCIAWDMYPLSSFYIRSAHLVLVNKQGGAYRCSACSWSCVYVMVQMMAVQGRQRR